uniref:Uncharacterized protein n=1 Tax=mine drainage metagenome TaxID=410659 RepID=E6PKD0_9ZZZZ
MAQNGISRQQLGIVSFANQHMTPANRSWHGEKNEYASTRPCCAQGRHDASVHGRRGIHSRHRPGRFSQRRGANSPG